MANKLVSIIIPAYNRGKYIRQCVQSALWQTYHPVEVIVVDDGSTDETRAILDEMATDPRLIVLEHPGRQNRGQSASLNLGIQHAKGDYINILDSDDYLEPEKLAVEVPFLASHPEIGLVYSNGWRTNADGVPFESFYPEDHREPNDPNAVLLDCYLLLPGNALVRRTAYDAVGPFEEAFRAAQDHDMLIRLAERIRFAYIAKHLFYYRMHADSISGKGKAVRWNTGFMILKRATRRFPYNKSTTRKRLAVLNYRLATVEFNNRLILKSAPKFFLAAILDPIRALKVLARLEKKT
ncbi:glycosyltransferase family 2 protein [Methylonatrum kenyense]|uniref:glycosyltransferase family 2 protein n=1 Tax=Methylonatrum kenyense TaxID=455253 RepID=UPI0020BFF3CB|nr:glycosyltransferase family A protein [Methylonatrum kenyense]MCK8516786.1 glycosyltransferase family 2 protein [Methylonatrum kenyense]